VLILRDRGVRIDDAFGDPVTRNLELVYQATFTGELTILVTGKANALGNYTLTVAKENPGR
jgi:phage protein U